jgi:histidinol-phosphate phosphatase family protein
MSAKRKCVFLDRDDTVIADPGYISDPGQVRLLAGAAEGIGKLSRAGYAIVVVTNQSGVARGLLTEETLRAVHAEMSRQLAQAGASVDAVYYCPYHPEGTVEQYCRDSDWRKPAPGMLLTAAAEMNLDLAASWMIGDSSRDIEAGRRAGCRTILVGPKGDPLAQADLRAADLREAADLILSAGR